MDLFSLVLLILVIWLVAYVLDKVWKLIVQAVKHQRTNRIYRQYKENAYDVTQSTYNEMNRASNDYLRSVRDISSWR